MVRDPDIIKFEREFEAMKKNHYQLKNYVLDFAQINKEIERLAIENDTELYAEIKKVTGGVTDKYLFVIDNPK